MMAASQPDITVRNMTEKTAEPSHQLTYIVRSKQSNITNWILLVRSNSQPTTPEIKIQNCFKFMKTKFHINNDYKNNTFDGYIINAVHVMLCITASALLPIFY